MTIRTGLTASTLNIFLPGSGHIYLGRASRFIIPFLASIALFILLSIFNLLSNPYGYVFYAISIAGVVLFGVIDGFICGFKQGRNTTTWYSRWFIVIGWVVIIISYSQILALTREKFFGYSTFEITSPIMSPAIQQNDIVLINTRNNKAIEKNRIVVFTHPKFNSLAIRRVRSITQQGEYELEADGLPSSTLLIPKEKIVGVATSILWSPTNNNFCEPLK